METGKKSRHGKGSQAHTRIPHPEQGAWGEEPVQRLVVKVNNDSVHLGETRVCWRPSAPPPRPRPRSSPVIATGSARSGPPTTATPPGELEARRTACRLHPTGPPGALCWRKLWAETRAVVVLRSSRKGSDHSPSLHIHS